MIMSLFQKDRSHDAGVSLYIDAVRQARSPALYTEFEVPDTAGGRFEMIVLHVYLIMRRLKAGGAKEQKTSQSLFDTMFQNLDDSLREMGVGDLSIPRKIRAMAENFYGRVEAYETALAADDEDALLIAAIDRNVYEEGSNGKAKQLCAYLREAVALIDEQTPSQISEGVIRFPDLQQTQ